eukprot:15339165-Ditylum_brightwellii.AAC.1
MLKYYPLKDITKLQICHMVAHEKDPGVIVVVKQLIAKDKDKDDKNDEDNNDIVEEDECKLILVGGDRLERKITNVDEDVCEAQENMATI